MLFHKIFLAASAVAVLVTAGCSSNRFADNASYNTAPVVLQAAPLGQVSQSTLAPPPMESRNTGDAANASMPVQQPSQITASGGIPMNAGILSPANVAGVWKASIGGMNCQIATPQTKFGKGYRAGPLRCPAAFSNVNSWMISGPQLIFYDRSGRSIATLYSSDGARFEGQTISGVQVVLSR